MVAAENILDLPECPRDFAGFQTTLEGGRELRMWHFCPEVFRGLPAVFFISVGGKVIASSDTWRGAVDGCKMLGAR